MRIGLVCAVVAAIVLGVAGAARAAPPIEAYGALPGVEQVAISPSGDRFAMIGYTGERRELIVLKSDGGLLLRGAIGDTKVRRLRWVGEGKVAVTISKTYRLGPDFTLSQYEISHVGVFDIASGKANWVLSTGKAGNGVWGDYGVVESGGTIYGYFGGLTLARSITGDFVFEDGHPDLYRIDLISGDTQLAANGADGDGVRHWLIGPDGKIAATFNYQQRSGQWKIHTEAGNIAEGVDLAGDVGLMGLGRTAGTLLFYRRDDDGDLNWFEAPLAGGAAVPILQDEQADNPVFDRRTRLLMGYLSDADKPQWKFLDAKTQKRWDATVKAFPGLNVQLASWSDGFGRLLVHTDGTSDEVNDSGTWWLVDLKTGKASIIGHDYPTVRSADVGPIRMVSWKATDGQAISGVLTLPPGREAKGLPVIVLPHGGPIGVRDYPQFDWWAQALAAQGYAVLQPNYRGSGGYGRAFLEAGYGQWGGRMLSDMADGLADLARQGVVDSRRACIVGASYGGYAALAGVTLQQGLYRCAVAVAGVSDLPALAAFDRDGYGSVSAAMRGFRQEIGSGRSLRELSPITLAGRADAPILLVHGDNDTVVPLEQSQAMAKALRKAGKPVELVVLKGEDHWLSLSSSRTAMLQAVVAFVQKHNPSGA